MTRDQLVTEVERLRLEANDEKHGGCLNCEEKDSEVTALRERITKQDECMTAHNRMVDMLRRCLGMPDDAHSEQVLSKAIRDLVNPGECGDCERKDGEHELTMRRLADALLELKGITHPDCPDCESNKIAAREAEKVAEDLSKDLASLRQTCTETNAHLRDAIARADDGDERAAESEARRKREVVKGDRRARSADAVDSICSLLGCKVTNMERAVSQLSEALRSYVLRDEHREGLDRAERRLGEFQGLIEHVRESAW